MKAWGILLIVFLSCGCTKLSPFTATVGRMPSPLELNFSEPPEFNEPVELTMDVVGGVLPYQNATIKIDLPDGFELVSGDLEGQADLTKDVPVQLKAVVKPIKTGDWAIKGGFIASEKGKRTLATLYVSVSEDSVEVSETPPPGFGAEPDAIESMITTQDTGLCPNGTDTVIKYYPDTEERTIECVPSS